ncbi:MAG: hypothetical protein FWC47_08605 [Oscillospiraceae bacterium]|nr:hypothetical protein [Oscillospiraceae bacterium]
MYNEKNFIIADNCPMFKFKGSSDQYLSYISNSCDNCVHYKKEKCKLDMDSTISKYLLKN